MMFWVWHDYDDEEVENNKRCLRKRTHGGTIENGSVSIQKGVLMCFAKLDHGSVRSMGPIVLRIAQSTVATSGQFVASLWLLCAEETFTHRPWPSEPKRARLQIEQIH
jgi:hypothetical protein